MRKLVILLSMFPLLPACQRPSGNSSGNEVTVVNASAPESQVAFCFFQDQEMKAWKAKIDKSGNVVVTGKAYREDPRYEALLGPATIHGTLAELGPTIEQNDTGFAAPQNWWNLTETIANSRAVERVAIHCGGKTIANLAVPRTK